MIHLKRVFNIDGSILAIRIYVAIFAPLWHEPQQRQSSFSCLADDHTALWRPRSSLSFRYQLRCHLLGRAGTGMRQVSRAPRALHHFAPWTSHRPHWPPARPCTQVWSPLTMLMDEPLTSPLPCPPSACHTTLWHSPYWLPPGWLFIHLLSIIVHQLHESRNMIYLPTTPACSPSLPHRVWGTQPVPRRSCAEWQ